MAETSDTTYYDQQAKDGYADGVEAAKAELRAVLAVYDEQITRMLDSRDRLVQRLGEL